MNFPDCRPYHTRLLDALGLAGIASCKSSVCSIIAITSLILLIISSTILVTIRSRRAASLQEQALVEITEAPEIDLPKPSFTQKVLSWFCFGNDKQIIIENTEIEEPKEEEAAIDTPAKVSLFRRALQFFGLSKVNTDEEVTNVPHLVELDTDSSPEEEQATSVEESLPVEETVEDATEIEDETKCQEVITKLCTICEEAEKLGA